jgi:tetratricopeptide (TPR) repeat protein
MRRQTNKPTDFETELERIDKEIAELKDNALSSPFDSERATRFVHRLYQRGALTGRFEELKVAEEAIDKVIPKLNHAEDLFFLKANIDFKFHRLADVRRVMEMCPELRASFQGRAIQADLYFQEGRYGDAEKEYEALIRDDKAWDDLARLAYLKFKMGDFDGAERLYIEAEDELTAKQMRHYAWVELQRGVIDLTRGSYEEALAHYERADRAYSGYWLIQEHMAELLGAQGKYVEAVELYRTIIDRLPRPEFQQALGELYQFMGNAEEAEHWFEKALDAYLESVERDEIHYYHHLVDFYSDVRLDGVEAVRWARNDLELRENFSTQAALAWSLYRSGQLDEALERMNEALSSGAKDAHLFSQAATIYGAVGESARSEHYSHLAAEINPHHQNFHVHR